MKEIIKNYFTFNKRERNGILILVSIVTALIITLNLSHHFYKKTATDFSEFEKEIAEFQLAQADISAKKFIQNYDEAIYVSNVKPDSAELFEFNPNQLPANEWKRLGLSDKQIRIIKNYEANGGKFKKKEDLLKIFGFTEKLYKSLENYVVIPAEEKSNTFKHSNYATIYKVQISSSAKKISLEPKNFNGLQDVSEYEENNTFKYCIGNEKNLSDAHSFQQIAKSKGYAQAFVVAFSNGKKISLSDALKGIQRSNSEKFQNKNLVIEINSADSTEWEKLRGIGPSYARRIVKYRESLGGFQNIEQLKEVWGMNDTLFNLILPHLSIDVSKMKKININSATAPDLQKHPYIKNWNVANAIVNYRAKHGNYKSVDEIKKTDLVNDSLFRKISPYLKTE